jgi:hypothetical protein
MERVFLASLHITDHLETHQTVAEMSFETNTDSSYLRAAVRRECPEKQEIP